MLSQDDDGKDQREEPDDDSEDEETIPCPYCGKPVWENSPRCPSCENYLSRDEAPADRLPSWVIAGFVLALLATLLWILTGF